MSAVRKVVTRRGRRIRGYFPSTKLGRMVAWESLLERDAILLLEFSPGVASYQEQPALVHYAHGLRMREYYPDFEVVLGCGSVLHLEVKPASKLALPAVAAKLRAVARHYAVQGRDYRIVTDQEIRREPLHSNLKTLTYLAVRPGCVLPARRDIEYHFTSGARTLQDAALLLGRDTTMRLIATGRICCDLDKELGDETLLSIPTGGEHAALLF